MIKNEYLSVREISQLTEQSTRNVRRIIQKLEGDVTKELLHLDNNNHWKIHNLLLGKFKPQRIRLNKYYALSVDPCNNYSESDIDKIIEFVAKQMGETKLELNYVVEKKKKNNQNHIHCFVKCTNKRKLIQTFRIALSKMSYHQSDIFDLESWKGYITKENNEIKTLKN